MSVKFVGVDLFAGAGGLGLGAKLAGIDVKVAVEFDSLAASTYRLNHPEVEVIQSDIRDVSELGVADNSENLILFGGPPCQGFSTSNQRTRNTQNQNNWLFLEYMRFVRQLTPNWVVIENVQGIMQTEKGSFAAEIRTNLELEGYTVTIWLLNAKDYGVPQSRTRCFIIGSKDGLYLNKPEPSKAPKVTVKDAISDLPILSTGASVCKLSYHSKPRSAYAKELRRGQRKAKNHLVSRNNTLVLERYKHIPQGGNWKNIPAELMENYKDQTRCHTGIYYRLKEEAPSVVIGNYRKNMLIHPTQDRGLSVREAARLQSFPDCYEFQGSIGSQQQQVGNAVPPLLAKAVFMSIMQNK